MSLPRPHRVDPPDSAVPHRPSSAAPQRAGPQLAQSECQQAAVDRRSDGCSRVQAAGGANHRVDSSHVSEPVTTLPIDAAGQGDWLRQHGADLVDRLQTWASDLDAREAQLNARTSLQDHRERRFRLQQQDVATELAEQQRSIERVRREIEAQARRLAFSSD